MSLNKFTSDHGLLQVDSTNGDVKGLSVASGKTHTVNNSITLAGTDGTTMTFPGTTDTVVTLTATQTLTNKTLTSPVITGSTTNGQILFISSGAVAADTSLDDGHTTANTLTYAGTGGIAITNGTAQTQALIVQNPTAATSGSVGNAPQITLAGTYWTGAASAVDQWYLTTSIATGTNGTSTLQLLHSGSTGNAIFQLGLGSSTNTGKLQVITEAVAAGGSNFSSPVISFVGAYYNNTSSVTDTWNIQEVLGAGATPTSTLTFSHAGSSGVASVSLPCTVSKYNSIATAGNGLVADLYQSLSTGLVANFNSGSAQTLFTPGAAGMYRISVYMATTTAATSSSTMPSITIGWTDAGGTARTKALIATSAGNTTTYQVDADMRVYTNGSTAVTLTCAGYASSGGTALAYCLGITAEQM